MKIVRFFNPLLNIKPALSPIELIQKRISHLVKMNIDSNIDIKNITPQKSSEETEYELFNPDSIPEVKEESTVIEESPKKLRKKSLSLKCLPRTLT